jgi:hypothetical protein
MIVSDFYMRVNAKLVSCRMTLKWRFVSHTSPDFRFSLLAERS